MKTVAYCFYLNLGKFCFSMIPTFFYGNNSELGAWRLKDMGMQAQAGSNKKIPKLGTKICVISASSVILNTVQ